MTEQLKTVREKKVKIGGKREKIVLERVRPSPKAAFSVTTFFSLIKTLREHRFKQE